MNSVEMVSHGCALTVVAHQGQARRVGRRIETLIEAQAGSGYSRTSFRLPPMIQYGYFEGLLYP